MNWNQEHWKHYLPAAICFGLALVFMLVPALAAFLLVTLLLSVGALYAWIVYRMHSLSKGGGQWRPQSGPMYPEGEPNFRNVSVHIFRQTPWA